MNLKPESRAAMHGFLAGLITAWSAAALTLYFNRALADRKLRFEAYAGFAALTFRDPNIANKGLDAFREAQIPVSLFGTEKAQRKAQEILEVVEQHPTDFSTKFNALAQEFQTIVRGEYD